MATSNIKALISGELSKVWELVLNVENYGAWRSDLSKTEVISDKQFIEYTKDGYPTTFTVTLVEPYRRWEFDMENSNMTGHWIGVFTDKGNETEIGRASCRDRVRRAAIDARVKRNDEDRGTTTGTGQQQDVARNTR